MCVCGGGEDLYCYHILRHFTSLSPTQSPIYWRGIYTVITYLTTLHQYHLPRHLHIDMGFIFLSPTEPQYTITYPSVCIWMWVLYYGHLRNHLHFDTVFTFFLILLLSQPATYLWRTQFILSDLNSFLPCSVSSHQPWSVCLYLASGAHGAAKTRLARRSPSSYYKFTVVSLPPLGG